MKKFPFFSFLVVFIIAALPAVYCQQKTVTGRVTDVGKQNVLDGVSITLKGTTKGKLADSAGNYSITAPANGVLVFSSMGYLTQEISINNRSVINVQLQQSTSKDMDEVVVVGYKSVIKKDVTGAVASINIKDLDDIPAPSLVNLLAGKAPGVQAVVRSGLPGGSGGGLVIRGNTSLSAASDVNGLSNPLYIVDGVPVSLEDLAGFDVSQNDFFSTLNPNDIQSIDVLKDAAATAIYGSRGANGVVIIKTKRGKSMKTRFNFSTAQGANFEPKKLKVFIGEAEREEKLRLYKESLKGLFGDRAWVDVRNGLEVEGYMLPAVLTDKYNPAFNNAYDYQQLFYQKGLTQQYDLSMDGGNEKNAFRVGLGYYDEKGVLVGFGFKRVTLNASLTTQVSKRLQNDLSFRLTYLDRKGGQTDNLRSFPTSPTQLPSSLYYKTDNELSLLSGKLQDTYNNNKTYLATINEGIRLKITDAITWDNQAAVSLNFGKKDYFVPSTASENFLSYAESSSSNNVTFNAHSIISYIKKFGDHEITGLAGAEVNTEQLSLTKLYAEGGPSDYIQVVQGFKKENVNGISDLVKSNLLSYFGNISYGYKDRYKIEGVLRRDGSSRFGANNKWTTFPSVKSYWIFSEEPLLKPLKDVLTFGKIRVSYGSSGSIAADPLLQYNSLITGTNIGTGINDIYGNRVDVNTYGGNGAIVTDFNKIANRSLSWSKSTEMNYGLDLEFFNHRLYVTGDIYSRYSSGLVYISQLAPQAGYNSIRSNLIDMISNGYELGITGYVFPRANKFQWDITLNLARNSSTIAKLGNEGRDYIADNYAFVLGRPAFQYYTYEYLGPLQNLNDLPVNPMTGEPMKYYGADAGLAINQQGKIFEGMPLFTDVNGDYLIDGGDYGNDKKIIQGKSPEPKIQGGLSTNIKFGNFNLRAQSSFAFGHYIFNTSLQQMLSQYDDNTLFFTNALYDMSKDVKFWQKSGDQAYYPMRYISYSDGGSARSFRESSMFIEKGDYWSVDNITLSYNVAQKIANRLGVGRVNFYTTVRNAYMWKASSVPDPRLVTKTGYYNGEGYPINRSMVLGVNIQF
ncbi:MAG: SusC/RagA family TonB-linked outer membrane protein [Ferruginibacter sp.]